MVELLGVSTVHGNASLKHTTSNTCAILQAMGRGDVPVVQGESRPLRREPCFAPEFHGESGLDGVSLLPKPDQARLQNLNQGVHHIASTIMAEPPNTVWLVATGPLTNIAKLFMESPEVVSHIRGLSIMGGAVGENYTDAPMHRKDGPGNWTSWAEFNIFCDPEAAQYIFGDANLAHKTTLIPLDLTHQCRGTTPVQNLLFHSSKTSHLRQLMQQVLTFFTATYHEHSGIEDGPPLHDPLAVYAAICPENFDDRDGERWAIDARLEGDDAGRTVLRWPDDSGVRVPRGLDLTAFWAAIDAALEKAEQRVATM